MQAGGGSDPERETQDAEQAATGEPRPDEAVMPDGAEANDELGARHIGHSETAGGGGVGSGTMGETDSGGLQH